MEYKYWKDSTVRTWTALKHAKQLSNTAVTASMTPTRPSSSYCNTLWVLVATNLPIVARISAEYRSRHNELQDFGVLTEYLHISTTADTVEFIPCFASGMIWTRGNNEEMSCHLHPLPSLYSKTFQATVVRPDSLIKRVLKVTIMPSQTILSPSTSNC